MANLSPRGKVTPDAPSCAQVPARLRPALSPDRAAAAATAADQSLWRRHPPDSCAASHPPVGEADVAVSASVELRPADPHPRNVLLGRRRRAGIGTTQPLPGGAG